MRIGRKETIKKYLIKKGCYCIDCGKLLSHQNVFRCRKCWVDWRKLGNGGLPPSQKGKEHKYFCGENNPKWKGGITSINRKIRHSKKYFNWRLSVFVRDNFKCQSCGQVGKNLNAHHIIPFCEDRNKRFDINNGITLCKKCHLKVEKKFYGNQYTK